MLTPPSQNPSATGEVAAGAEISKRAVSIYHGKEISSPFEKCNRGCQEGFRSLGEILRGHPDRNRFFCSQEQIAEAQAFTDRDGAWLRRGFIVPKHIQTIGGSHQVEIDACREILAGGDFAEILGPQEEFLIVTGHWRWTSSARCTAFMRCRERWPHDRNSR